jgi:hypothetical protein
MATTLRTNSLSDAVLVSDPSNRQDTTPIKAISHSRKAISTVRSRAESVLLARIG